MTRPASTTPNMDPPDNYQTTYDSKTNIVVFYSQSITISCSTRPGKDIYIFLFLYFYRHASNYHGYNIKFLKTMEHMLCFGGVQLIKDFRS